MKTLSGTAQSRKQLSKYGKDVPVGVITAGQECDYDVIDSTGKVLIDFPAHSVFQLEYLGENLFYVTSADLREKYVYFQFRCNKQS